MKQTIRFYSTKDEYGCFSNFAPYPIEVDGQLWPTSEHYFQAQKFEDADYREKIRTTKSAMIAARLGRSRKVPIKANWNAIKDDVMRKAVQAKFAQHAELQAVLLSTGNAEIIEHTTNDRYWGDGGDGTGKNMLGHILMQVRDEIKGVQ
jgi:N-glycosidase YbiA